MERTKALLREPALLIDAFESLVVVLIALGLFSLHGDAQTNLVALFIAVLALVKGFFTRPFPVTVIPDLGRAGLVFCVSLGVLKWSPDQVTVLVTFLGTLMTVVQRAQITPSYDSVARPGGAGAGPLSGRNDVGATSPLYALGVALAVIGAVLIVADLLSATIATLWVGVVFLLIGIVLIFVSGRGRTGGRTLR